MSTIKFANDTELPIITAIAINTYAQGAQRRGIEIQMAKDAITFDVLDALTADSANTAQLTLIDGDKQYVHDNYSIRAELAVKAVEITPATDTAPAETEDRLCVTLAQLTYLEVTQATQAMKQTQTDAAIAELSVLIAGGNE
ncbi:hypothetical protein [Clostridium sp. KNHs216]|uniref:hypothetical protein n=1 Tax=Clostridium sp. KNHs216 TaxID=1550235 RepID=UPI0011702A62|nr:hypothetical protein [Clostridium sp. KNHs216]TQI66721.1 hypothetical protein LY85_1392 [Clostridium sp. KNHs216]